MTSQSFPRIYPITDRNLSGLSHTEQVKQLIDGGAMLIQLREKELPRRDFFEDAKCCVEIARAANVKILINDRVDLAMALCADGVHLGQDDLPPAEARKLMGGNAIIGFSTHNLEQARQALKLPVDYVAIGPIFATSTKKNPDPVIGIKGIKELRKIAGNKTIVAIGGINEYNLGEVFAAGADSAAMIEAVVGAPSIVRTMRRFSR
ncbi:MAG TPA: thiamine phosphate synthase [Pyrinomonadaceae bacterium]|jgi:thiamine-phosphate pyrophosphorylase|nr:thiamine phosphate synthase [Pyrinomonadaceae bacterium]